MSATYCSVDCQCTRCMGDDDCEVFCEVCGESNAVMNRECQPPYLPHDMLVNDMAVAQLIADSLPVVQPWLYAAAEMERP